MALRNIRIGSLEDVHVYDDSDFSHAADFDDEPIKVGDPVDPDDAVNLRSLASSREDVVDITNPTELNSVVGEAGQLVIAYQEAAGGIDYWTIYAYDDDGPAVNSPYVVDASGVGSERWVAIAGRYSYINQYIRGYVTVERLSIYDTNQSNVLRVFWSENDTVDRILSIFMNSANRNINLGGSIALTGDLTITGAVAINQNLRTVDSPTFANLTVTAGASGAVTVLTAIQAGGAGALGIQYKDRVITFTSGIVTNIAAESGWNDI